MPSPAADARPGGCQEITLIFGLLAMFEYEADTGAVTVVITVSHELESVIPVEYRKSQTTFPVAVVVENQKAVNVGVPLTCA